MSDPRDTTPSPDDPQRLLQMALQGMQEPESTARVTPPTAAELETALPQFEVYGLIGQGGMGAVYKVREKKLDRIVALKVLPRELVKDPEFEERFVREARAQGSLSHPHILTVYDFGETPDFFYIVAEFIDGVDLRQLMNMGRLSPLEALRIVPQICDALQFAHDQGVVHRDIKPENILLDQNGDVRIADFGLAKIAGGQDVTLTRTEQGLGTPHYMAPEQMTGARQVDHRADIYALGVVLYEMLTGQLPIGHFEVPSKKAGTAEALDSVVMRALAHAVEDRYQKMADVKADVQGAGDRQGATRTESKTEARGTWPATAAVPPADRRLCKRPLVALVLILLTLVGSAMLLTVALADEAEMHGHATAIQRYEAHMKQIRVFEQESGKAWTRERPVDPSRDYEEPRPYLGKFISGVVNAIVCILVIILGFTGIAAIKRSGGRLTGLGLAVVVAWMVPLALVSGLIFAPVTGIRDADLRGIAMPIVGLLLVVLNIVFLHWQYKRHRADMA